MHDRICARTGVETHTMKHRQAVDDDPTGDQWGDRSSSHGYTISHQHQCSDETSKSPERGDSCSLGDI